MLEGRTDGQATLKVPQSRCVVPTWACNDRAIRRYCMCPLRFVMSLSVGPLRIPDFAKLLQILANPIGRNHGHVW